MHLKSILNRVERHKCFVYKQVRFVDGLVEPELEVEIEPRANSRAICSGCGEKRPGYDRLSPRRFQFVPFWNITVFFVYAMRRVDCPTCGVTVERVPWGEGKEHLTTSYRWFLARWAKRLSWKETADAFNTTWDNVFRSVKHAVERGLTYRDLSGIEAIGVDEIQWRSGHTYLTLVYQIDGVKRLLWVAQDRTEQSLRGFFTSLTAEVRAGIRFVCSDLWRQYLNVIAEQIPADPQLVPGSRHHLVGRCRGIQRQSKTDHQKSVRLQDAAGHRNRPLSRARPITGAQVHPQILLRRLISTG